MKRILNRPLFFLFLVVTPLIAHSQDSIVGYVKSKNYEPIANATIFLKDLNKNIISYAISRPNGYFVLIRNNNVSTYLFAQSLNFEKDSIFLPKGNLKRNIEFLLNERIEQLKEVEIKYQRKNFQKGDTIVFNASAYLDGQEEVLEDLIKKIPGAEVSENGKIKINQKEIDRILIDGDDLFSKNYTLLSKNLPVNAVNQLEILQNYSKNKLLKGIESTDKIALNITIKEEYKNIWFGDVQLAYDVLFNNFYQSKLNLINLKKKVKTYFLVNSNNIGIENPSTGINYLSNEEETSDYSDLLNSKFNWITPTSNTTIIKKQRTFINDSHIISMTNLLKISNKQKLRFQTNWNINKEDFNRVSNIDYLNLTQPFSIKNVTTSQNKLWNTFNTIDYENEINNNNNLKIKTIFQFQNLENENNFIFNNNPIEDQLNNKYSSLETKGQWVQKVNDFKVNLYDFKIRYLNSTNYYQQLPNYYELLFPSLQNFDQEVDFKYSDASIQFLSIRNKKNWYSEIKSNLSTLNQSFNSATNASLSDNNFTNNLIHQQWVSSNSFLIKKIFQNFSLETQIPATFIGNNIKSYSFEKYFISSPKVTVSFKSGNSLGTQLSISRNEDLSNLDQFIPNYYQSNFRFFRAGNNSFQILKGTNLQLVQSYSNFKSQTFFNLLFNYHFQNSFSSTNTVVNDNYELISSVFLNYNESIQSFLYIDKFIPNLKINFKSSFGYFFRKFQSSVQDELRMNQTNSYNINTELKSGFLGKFNFAVGNRLSISNSKVEGFNSFKNYFNHSFVDIHVNFTPKTKISIINEAFFSGQKMFQNPIFFIDINLKQTIIPNKLFLSLVGNNLLNNLTYKNVMINDFGVISNENQLVQRFFLLKIDYRL